MPLILVIPFPLTNPISSFFSLVVIKGLIVGPFLKTVGEREIPPPLLPVCSILPEGTVLSIVFPFTTFPLAPAFFSLGVITGLPNCFTFFFGLNFLKNSPIFLCTIFC